MKLNRFAMVLPAALILAGCGSATTDAETPVDSRQDTGYGEVEVVTVDVKGVPTTCVIYTGFREGNIDCDFS